MSMPPTAPTIKQSITRALSSPAGNALVVLGRVRGAMQDVYKRPKDRQGSKDVAARETPGVRTQTAQSTPASWGGRALLYLFIVTVAIPTFLSAIYFIFIASDQYLSETRMAVRAASDDKQSISDSLSVFSKLGLSAGKASVQDSYIVLNYIRSRAIIDDIGGKEYVEANFSWSSIDFMSRLSANKPMEDIEKYWRTHVLANIDTPSGIVTVKVFAYRPETAHAIAERIVQLSEAFVNKVSERTRSTAVAEAAAEFESTKRDLSATRAALQVYRNQSVTIDPVEKATSIGELIGKLMVQHSEIETTLATFAGNLTDASPAVKIQKNQLAALDSQIADLRKQLTSNDSSATTISSELAKFEQLKLEEKFAEQKFTVATMGYDKAQRELQRQKLFLALVVPPSLAESALFPERGTDILLTLTAALIFWGIVSLISASIADHFVY
jgi:capsular polysaccharide transport system permease protein